MLLFLFSTISLARSHLSLSSITLGNPGNFFVKYASRMIKKKINQHWKEKNPPVRITEPRAEQLTKKKKMNFPWDES